MTARDIDVVLSCRATGESATFHCGVGEARALYVALQLVPQLEEWIDLAHLKGLDAVVSVDWEPKS